MSFILKNHKYGSNVLFFLLLIIISAFSNHVYAKKTKQNNISIVVTPNNGNCTYKLGENVFFTVKVLENGKPLNNIDIDYKLQEEGKLSILSKKAHINKDSVILDAGTLGNVGFLRCKITLRIAGNQFFGISTVGFEPEKIVTATSLPEDFITFWDKEKERVRKIPLSSQLTLVDSLTTEKVSVYHVSYQNNQLGSRIYGILSIPKEEGKFPAVISFPGAGARSYKGLVSLAEKGIITLEVGIHGIPVNQNVELYNSLMKGAFHNYPKSNLHSREEYYFNRVYTGCVKAVDFIYSLKEFNQKDVVVTGSSQGGALSIVTAALDSRVNYLAVYCPALAELTGFMANKASGWPNIFNDKNLKFDYTQSWINTVRYYDVVNFARFIKIPGFYSWGYNDEVTPPSSIYSAYNIISAPKEILIVPELAHVVNIQQRNEALKRISSILFK